MSGDAHKETKKSNVLAQVAVRCAKRILGRRNGYRPDVALGYGLMVDVHVVVEQSHGNASRVGRRYHAIPLLNTMIEN